MRVIFSIVCSLFLGNLLAQVSTLPPFPLTDSTVTVVFDASLGNGALAGYSPIYMHSGIITSESQTPSDWQRVQGSWGTADAKMLMTDIGDDKHEISFKIRDFYNVPQDETVISMAYVFRNEAGTIVGRASDGSDIFYPVFDGSFVVTFTSPQDNFLIKTEGEVFTVSAKASAEANLQLIHDGLLQTAVSSDSLTFDITAGAPGNHQIIVRGDNGITDNADTIKYVVNPTGKVAYVPAGTKQGINYINNSSIRLFLYAPEKEFVYVIGDFTNWELNTDYFMTKTPNGNGYWIDINGLSPIKDYSFQYFVDGEILTADPFSELVLDGSSDAWIPEENYPDLPRFPYGKTSGIVSYVKTGRQPYDWKTTNYQRPAKEDLVIYEILMRDFTLEQSFQEMFNRIDYLEDLGVNAIQFMPVNEYEGNNSWGYNPSFHTAMDKMYGSADKFREIIDYCHSKGIAVILDVVLNHAFGQSPFARMYWNDSLQAPASNNPWLNQEAFHPFNVGNDFNHEVEETKYIVDRVLKYWVEEFNIDGYRFDLSKGITQNYTDNIGAWSAYDQSRLNLLGRMMYEIRQIDPEIHLILEHFGDANEEIVLANDFNLMLWGQLNSEYSEAVMGYVNSSSDLTWGVYNARGWNNPNLVTFMESHDEERLMHRALTYGNSNGSYNIRDLGTALDRIELASVLFYAQPGPKMIWQFGELGYDYSIELCENGLYDYECRIDRKPIRWDYYEDPDRKDLYEVTRNMIHLKTTYPTFKTTNFNYFLDGAIKSVYLYHPDFDAVSVGNFDVTDQSVNVSFASNGTWYEYFTQTEIQVNNFNETFNFEAGEYRLYTNQKLEKLEEASLEIDNYTSLDRIEKTENFISIYPNPANNFVFIQNRAERLENVVVSLLDINGSLILKKEIGSINQSSAHQLKLPNMETGVYTIMVTSDKGLMVKSLVIQD